MPRRNKVTQARSQSQRRKSRQNLNQDPRPNLKSNPNHNLNPSNPNPIPSPSRSLNQQPSLTKPEVVAESPEKVADRVKDAFAKAKTAADFRVVAVDALKLIDQANTAGKQDVGKSVVTLALSAARKADRR